MLGKQIKKVQIATEDQARTFSTLIGDTVVLAPGPKVTAVLILPEIIYIYPTRSATLARLVADPNVTKVVPCPIPTLSRYGWSSNQSVVVAGALVKEQERHSLSDYTSALIDAGQKDNEESRICAVVQLIYQFVQ